MDFTGKSTLFICALGSLGLLLTKREDTTKASIALSIIAINIDRPIGGDAFSTSQNFHDFFEF